MPVDQAHLLQTLVIARWLAITAMPVQNNRSVLFEIVFATDEATIQLTGKDHYVRPNQEAFSLSIREFTDDGLWKRFGVGATSEWRPTDVRRQLHDRQSVVLCKVPRVAVFYTSKLLQDRVTDNPELLDDCAAIEFKTAAGQEPAWLTIAASYEYPCCLDYAMTEGESDRLLASLVPITVSL